MGFGSLGVVLLLAAAGQGAPLDGYNVGLWAVGRSPALPPTWQTYVAASALTCQPLADLTFPTPESPHIGIVAEGIHVGLTPELTPTAFCWTPPLHPPEPGDFQVKIQVVTTTNAGTVYGMWTVADTDLHLQLEPRVACAVSGWYDWSAWSAWTPVVVSPGAPLAEERTRTRTRDVVVPATGGGAACPVLTETEREAHGVPDPASAVFVKSDATTQGAWLGRYGAQGAVMVGVPLPPLTVATVVPSGAQTYVWAESTTDPRALVKPGVPAPSNGAPPEGISATWYSPTSFVLDLQFTDQQQHQVAVHMIDWDERERRMVVDVLDSMDGALVPTQPLTSYTGGVYFVYLLSGHVRLRFFNNNNAPEVNATASAVFIDPPSTVPIPCAVSAWTQGLWGPWLPLNSTTEQRSRTDTRTITTPPSGGGTACPALTETVTETRPLASLTLDSFVVRQCLVSLSAPPPPNTEPGWIAAWYVDSGLFAEDSTAPYSGLVQTSVGTHAFQVRWTRPASRAWWRRLFGLTRAGGVVTYDPVSFVCQ